MGLSFIPIFFQADILVSELLGSFSDNELSPECIDGAQEFLKGDTGLDKAASFNLEPSLLNFEKQNFIVSLYYW